MTMPPQLSSEQSLRAENADLRARLDDAEATLRDIRVREMDALVAEGDAGPRLFALQGLDDEQHRLRDEMLARCSEAMIAVDTVGRITFFNAAAERQYGVRAADVLGRELTAVFTRHWPSPEDEAAAWTALRGQGVWQGEYHQRTPQGRELHVDASMSLLRDSQGDIIGQLSVVRDITERHHGQAALRRNTALFSEIIEQAPGGVYVVDAQFRVAQMNAESLPFFASAQPLIGRDFDEALGIVWGPEMGPQIASIFRHTMATGERYVSPRFSEQRHDIGVVQAFEWETQRVTLPDGQLGVVCYFKDVTERERSEAARRES
ncbi:MAG: PAS domain-containing protein, partial [Polaromonas sp.]|nr:PAS domain-containing protein [Gemmatimonadaceae bacterium]